jgi:hypothetical protein
VRADYNKGSGPLTGQLVDFIRGKAQGSLDINLEASLSQNISLPF